MMFDQIIFRLSNLFGVSPKVKWLNWEVTDLCNSRCQLCDIWKSQEKSQALSLEQIKSVFSDPLFKKLKYIILTGGEPVLRKDLIDIILFIHSKLPKVGFTISTNALLPERVISAASEAVKKGVHIDVGISLDGIGEHHDKIRGVPGNYEKADQLIKKLLELKKTSKGNLGIIVGQTIHPLTIDYIDEVRDYAKKMGVEYLAQLYDEAPYYHNIGKSKISDKELNKMISSISRLAPSFHNEVLLEILKNKKIKFDCFALRSFFILRANGDIMPCLRMCDVQIGNVKERTPSEIWKSKEAKHTRESVKKCSGCSNTWATDWSKESNSLPFLGLIYKAFIRKLRGS